jgi:hypothetical protein
VVEEGEIISDDHTPASILYIHDMLSLALRSAAYTVEAASYITLQSPPAVVIITDTKFLVVDPRLKEITDEQCRNSLKEICELTNLPLGVFSNNATLQRFNLGFDIEGEAFIIPGAEIVLSLAAQKTLKKVKVDCLNNLRSNNQQPPGELA